jgi:hypothetical protein
MSISIVNGLEDLLLLRPHPAFYSYSTADAANSLRSTQLGFDPVHLID